MSTYESMCQHCVEIEREHNSIAAENDYKKLVTEIIFGSNYFCNYYKTLRLATKTPENTTKYNVFQGIVL